MNKTDKQSISDKKNKKKKRKFLKFFLIILLLIIIAFSVFITIRTKKNGGGLSGFLSTMVGHDEETLKNLDPIYALLLGESQGLTDTIMIGAYDPKTQQASLLSIPRDTFIGVNKNYATAYDKINSLYKKDNPKKILEAVNDLTNLDLQYYVVIDTAALKELVDAIGGVYYDVPIDMNYTDKKQNLYINLEAGYQLLDGDKAEQLVRFRHNQDGSSYSFEYGDNDFGRMKTQRNFIKAVLEQTLKAKNIFKINEFLDIFNKNVSTNIPLSLAKDYVPYAVDFDINKLKSDTLPGQSEKCNGVWLFIHSEELTQDIIDEFFTFKTEEEISKSDIKIELLNASGNSNLIEEVTELLENSGYTVYKSGNSNLTSKSTIVDKSNISSTILEDLKNILSINTTSSSVSANSTTDITIIIGSDYK